MNDVMLQELKHCVSVYLVEYDSLDPTGEVNCGVEDVFMIHRWMGINLPTHIQSPLLECSIDLQWM